MPLSCAPHGGRRTGHGQRRVSGEAVGHCGRLIMCGRPRGVLRSAVLEELPGPWAADREAEGWDGLGMYDHWYLSTVGRGLFHPFAVLGNVAGLTSRLRLTTTFANNLARSPVEFAQAALTLQYLSAGRFDAGLGAGWSAQELEGAGL